MLEEGNETGGEAHQLHGAHIDVFNVVRAHHGKVAGFPCPNQGTCQTAVGVHRRIRFGNGGAILPVRGKVNHFVGDLPLDNPAVRCFQEAEPVDGGVDGKGCDKADVGTFRSLHRTNPAVMGVVHVPHVEAGPFTGQATLAQSAGAALMGKLRQRVRLLHELGKLTGPEEGIDDAGKRSGVHKVLRAKLVLVLVTHLVPDCSGHSAESLAELLAEKLAHGLHPAVAQVIDVIGGVGALPKHDQVVNDGHQVLHHQGKPVHGGADVKPFIELVASHFAEAVALAVKEHASKVASGVVKRRGFRTPESLVNPHGGRIFALVHAGAEAGFLFGKGFSDTVEIVPFRTGSQEFRLLDAPGEKTFKFFHGFHRLITADENLAGFRVGYVFREGSVNEVAASGLAFENGIEFLLRHGVEGRQNLGVGGESKRPEKHGDRNPLVAPVDNGENLIIGVKVDLEPGSPLGNNPGAVYTAVPLLHLFLEEDSGAPVKLADDNPLRPVDDKRTAVCHYGKAAKEYLLVNPHLETLRLGITGYKPHHRVQVGAKGDAPFQGFLYGMLGWGYLIAHVLKGKLLACALNRKSIQKNLV